MPVIPSVNSSASSPSSLSAVCLDAEWGAHGSELKETAEELAIGVAGRQGRVVDHL